MSRLSQIKTGKQYAPRKIGIYGGPGIGKTSFASYAPASVFIPTEDGANDLPCAQMPLCKDLQAVIDSIDELITGEHEYQVVSIDSMTQLERLIWQSVCQSTGKKSIEEIEYQKGYIYALEYWQKFFLKLDELREKRGMAIILTAHEVIERVEPPDMAPYDRYSIKCHKKAAAMIWEWCDELLFARKVITIKSADKKEKTKAQAIGGEERILCTEGRPAYVAKNRLGMPAEIPFEKENSWNEYYQYLKASREEIK